MPKSFDLTCKKGYYINFFNSAENLDYVGPYPKPKFYGADYMSSDERAQFLEWREEEMDKPFFAISRNSWPTAWMLLMY